MSIIIVIFIDLFYLSLKERLNNIMYLIKWVDFEQKNRECLNSLLKNYLIQKGIKGKNNFLKNKTKKTKNWN